MKNKYIVYKYTDLIKNKVVYIGILEIKNERKRNLRDRIVEHLRRDDWSKGKFKVEYFIVNSRTDAEFLEAHLISLYKTYKYHNIAKRDWGISEYICKQIDWIDYIEYDCLSLEEFYNKNKIPKNKKERQINMYDMYTRQLIRKFSNIDDVEVQTNFSACKILSCCHRCTYSVDKEYIFRFADDCEDIYTYKIPKSSGKIVQLTKDYSYVNIFKTSQEIAELFNTSRASINICLNGKGKTSRGYRWMYYEDYLDYLKNKVG